MRIIKNLIVLLIEEDDIITKEKLKSFKEIFKEDFNKFKANYSEKNFSVIYWKKQSYLRSNIEDYYIWNDNNFIFLENFKDNYKKYYSITYNLKKSLEMPYYY